MQSTTKQKLNLLLSTSLLFSSTHVMAREKCEWVFYKPALLELNLGVRQTGKAEKPLGIKVVDSRYKALAETINAFATWVVGPAVKLDVINKVAQRFLSDTSAEPYFVKLARAFDLKYSTHAETLQKNIPAQGPAIVVLNHPRNGSDGIAVAAAISKIRPDTKVAMTLFLENVPGMSENAIFLNPYGGKKAQEFNRSRVLQMQEHLKQGGLIVIFASGEVSVKDPQSNLKPVDPEWKTGVAKLVGQVPETQVIPSFVGGEASPEFYQVRKKGLGLRTTIFHVRELANNVSRDFPLSFSAPIAGNELLQMFGSDLKGMMTYLRARSYLMNEQVVLKEKAKVESSRTLEAIAINSESARVHEALAAKGKLVFADAKKNINVYAIEGREMPDFVWHELGIAREKSFRVVGEGSGKSMDIDAYDRHYVHIIAMDTATNKMLGAYRVGKVDEILKAQGHDGVYTSNFFEHQPLLKAKGDQMLELGRSFVDFEAGSKAIVALDRLWKGVTSYIADNPKYRYLIGPVSISNAYSTTSKLLMLSYLNKHKDNELAPLIKGKTPIEFSSQFMNEINLVAQKTPDLKELNKLVFNLDGQSIPPLLISYDKLGAKYLAFDRDKSFNTVDGLIIVDLLSKDAVAEASKHFGEKWSSYLNYHGIRDSQ
ncbi:MAG: lysophospholipid acyltransferase family protein [Bdellovibrionia bacterium]